MIKVKIEVRNEAAGFTTVVYAESIRRAVQMAEDCYPGNAARVVFPIEPDDFFVKDSCDGGYVDLEVSEQPKEAREAVGVGAW